METKRPAKGIATTHALMTVPMALSVVETKRPAKGIATSKSEDLLSSPIVLVETKRPAKGIATAHNPTHIQANKFVETKRPAKGIATENWNFSLLLPFSGNQETRQGDCDFVEVLPLF